MGRPTSQKWLIGCGLGCGVIGLLLMLGLFGGSYVVMHPFRSAIEVRETLDEKYGQQDEFTPAVDGAVSPDRMEIFLKVREKVMELCAEFEQTDGQFKRLDELHDDASKTEILGEFFSLTKTVLNMGPMMGEFFSARNGALLAAGMGRGEYTYIYVLAYRDRLRPPVGGNSESQQLHSQPNERVRRVLTQMLRNQLAALEVQISTAGDTTLADIRRVLLGELSKLENDPHRIPWQDNLPPAVAASLEPYRLQLDGLFCEHTVALEFTQNRRRFFGIQGD